MSDYQPHRGEDHGRAKLTEAQVRKIRTWPKSYGYRKMLAGLFGVSTSTIDDVRTGRSWMHLDREGDPR